LLFRLKAGGEECIHARQAWGVARVSSSSERLREVHERLARLRTAAANRGSTALLSMYDAAIAVAENEIAQRENGDGQPMEASDQARS
jgi:hypothetical protein